MLKEKLNLEIKRALENKLKDAQFAAKQAHDAAIDDQSVAETQYDTLAIESAYLAEGQSRRIEQYRDELIQLEHFMEKLTQTQLALNAEGSIMNSIPSINKVKVGDVVIIAAVDESDSQLAEPLKHYYLMPIAAGLEISQELDSKTICFTVITPQSPLGKRLLGCELDEEIELSFNAQSRLGEIIEIS